MNKYELALVVNAKIEEDADEKDILSRRLRLLMPVNTAGHPFWGLTAWW